MSSKTKITLSKGGTAERKVKLSQITIPNLYNSAENIRKNPDIQMNEQLADKIQECWQLAHALKNHIEGLPD